MSTPRWRLKPKHDRRFRDGHPWVYSNELADRPAALKAGDWVRLEDAGGEFLSWGMGNPHSLIALRRLGFDPSAQDAWVEALTRAGAFRFQLGLGLKTVSHRLCFGEGDGLPGLVIDRYVVDSDPSLSVFCVQTHTAGMDRWWKESGLGVLEQAVKNFQKQGVSIDWEQSVVVLRNDVSVRKLEGLETEAPRVVKAAQGSKNTLNEASLSSLRVRVRGESLEADFLGGQKTGLFLDQSENIEFVTRLIQKSSHPTALRVLDLCCYVGQWSTAVSKALGEASPPSVTLLDASENALSRAKKNVLHVNPRANVTLLAEDVLPWIKKPIAQGETALFDLVICDPPALIKGRKDIPTGKHAYLALNTGALARVAPGGLIVTCSCSSLLSEDEFQDVLSKAQRRAGKTVRWIYQGGQGADHPRLAAFPEGRYLKCWVGEVQPV